MEKREVKELITDAEKLYEEALKEVKVDKIRNGAEKAWGAVVRATDALLVDRGMPFPTGPTAMRDRRDRLSKILLKEPELMKMGVWERFHARESDLHGRCFYEGVCEPKEFITLKIFETKDYLEDVKRLLHIM